MGVIIPVGYAQANLKFTVNGKIAPMVMTLGIGPNDALTANQIALAVQGAWTTGDAPFNAANLDHVVNDYSFVGVDVTLMDESGPLLGSSSTIVTGAATQDGSVINSAVLVRKGTNAGGRKNRGRFYMPPFSLYDVNVDINGNIDQVIVTALQGEMSAFRTNLVSGEVTPYLLHSDVNTQPTEITSFTVQSRVATQRRRLR